MSVGEEQQEKASRVASWAPDDCADPVSPATPWHCRPVTVTGPGRTVSILHAIFQPGLFSNSSVQDAAAVVGAVVALVCAPVGVFTVVRGQSFAGHAFADITATGGSAAFLLGVSPLLGFVAMALAGAGATEFLGAERRRGRDLATGVLLGAGLGLSALTALLDDHDQSTTGAAVTVLFGSIFAVSTATLPLVIGFGVLGPAPGRAGVPAFAPQLDQPRPGQPPRAAGCELSGWPTWCPWPCRWRCPPSRSVRS